MEKRPAAVQSDLTQGSVWRQLVKYSAPLVLSSLLQAAYSLVDVMVVGHYVGPSAISAVNNASMVMNMLTQIIIGLTTGGNILIGQYFGKREMENCKKTTVTLYVLTLILGVVVAAVMYFCSGPILHALDAPSYDEALIYLQWCSIGVFFIFGYNGIAAVLRAYGNSRQPLYFIAITTVVNIVLDIVFVGPLHMGTEGAALATMLAQAASYVASLIYILMHYDVFGLSLKRLRIYGDKLKRILKLGIPCAIQWSVASISWLAVTYIVNQYGTFVSAGSGIAAKIKDLCQLFISAMATSATAMIAQNIGAGAYDRAKKTMYTAMKITIGMSLVLIAIVEIFAPVFVACFTDNAISAEAAVTNLRIEILGQVFYASFLVYHALALGAGHTMFAFASSFTNCILVRLVLAFVLNHYFGILGLYWACMIAPSVSVPLGWLYTRSNVWRRPQIAKED